MKTSTARSSRLSARSRIRAVVASAAAILLAVSIAPVAAQAASLGTNVSPNTSNYSMSGQNIFFAYVEEGEYVYSWGNQGSATLYRPGVADLATGAVGGSAAFHGPHEVTAETAGVWTFRFGSATNWNITVFDGDPGADPVNAPAAAELPGRAWVNSYTITQTSSVNKDIDFWMLNDNGYQYYLGLTGFYGITSEIVANSLGVPLGTSGGLECTPSYRSWDTHENAAVPPAGCADPYRLFFEVPATDLPIDAPIAPTEFNGNETIQVIKPEPVDPADLGVADFGFTPTTPGSRAGTFNYDLGGFIGGHFLEIDVDGDGDFEFGDGEADRQIRVGAAGEPVSFAFDGLDANGEALETCTPMNARIYFDRIGEVHVIQWDVERRGGIEITRQNGPDAPDSTIYWDDTQTPVRNGSFVNPPYTADGTAGADSSQPGVHGWNLLSGTQGNQGWGDQKQIDDWTYLEVDTVTDALAVPGQCLEIEKTSNAEDAQVGDVVEYTVTATNTGTQPYTEENPAYVVDDLSDVLDDAVFNGAVATIDGSVVDAPVLTGDRLMWEGALAPGESVEITYSVDVVAGGDGVGRNVAFAPPPGDTPDETETPDCDPPTDGGFDPVAGVFCGTTTFMMPQLNIEKTASRADLPAVGETVTYTVTGTNGGEGNFTAADPAIVIDDLTEVLDDATLVDGSLTANLPGSLEIVDNRIVWQGALASSQSVVISYEVEYTAEGDANLINVAFGPPDTTTETPECDPREAGLDPATGLPCDISRVPGADLSVMKSVSPFSGTNVEPGDVLDFTLTFTNNGQADAEVDYTDIVAGLEDDATLVAPTSAGLTASAIVDGAFTVTGSVPAGETYTVTYSATVLPFDEQGDHVLDNFLVETGTEPPAVCVPGSELCTINYVPNLVVGKVATPEAGASVQSGDELDYTLTFTNTGTGVATVDKVDDLSGVLDDAELTDGPDTVNLTAVANGNLLEISGPVVAGSPETVTYTVTVRPDGEHGDNVLANFVLDPGTETPDECLDGPCTSHPVGELYIEKSVNPASGTTVDPGEELDYTIAFLNVGTGDYDVNKIDDLSGVLDDADLTAGPVAINSYLAVADSGEGVFTITGTMPGSAIDAIEYSVTVRPDGERGDDSLGNFVLDPGESPPLVCVPEEPALCSVNSVSGTVVATKSVTPSEGTDVRAGDVLTYTLTFTNEGVNPGVVDFVDHLDGVLDDADFGAIEEDGDLLVDFTEPKLLVQGMLDGSEVTTVEYTVVVLDDGNRNDDLLANFVLPNGMEFTGGVCEEGDPTCTFNPILDTLPMPVTGGTINLLVIVGALGALGVGLFLVSGALRARQRVS